jgi:hypothetical protein
MVKLSLVFVLVLLAAVAFAIPLDEKLAEKKKIRKSITYINSQDGIHIQNHKHNSNPNPLSIIPYNILEMAVNPYHNGTNVNIESKKNQTGSVLAVQNSKVILSDNKSKQTPYESSSFVQNIYNVGRIPY